MGLMRIWSYLRGYVEIVIEGKQIEKFINMAVSRGYDLWDIFQPQENVMIAKVDLAVYPALRHVARACRCKMRIRRKKGFPFAAVKMRRRKMLLVGAVLFLVSLYILSSFVWSVEVTSTKELKMITQEQVLEAASEFGIKPGTPRFLIDNNRVAEELEKKFLEISWAGVELRGTKVIINVVEKVLPNEDPDSARPGNIVAQKDGLVKEILVLAGEPQVAAGDTVKKGDVLISGVIYPESLPEDEKEASDREPAEEGNQQPSKRPVHVSAKGLVRARIWYESTVQIPLIQQKEELTGKKRQFVVLRLYDKEIVLKDENQADFKKHRQKEEAKRLVVWRYKLPVWLVTTTFEEIEKKEIYYNMAEARALAQETAMKDITSKLPEGTQVVSKKDNVTSVNERELKVIVYVETVENIGGFVPLQ